MQESAVAVSDLLSGIPREFEETVAGIPNRAVGRCHIRDDEGLALHLRPQQTRVLIHAPIAQSLGRSAEGVAIYSRRWGRLYVRASGLSVAGLELALHAAGWRGAQWHRAKVAKVAKVPGTADEARRLLRTTRDASRSSWHT